MRTIFDIVLNGLKALQSLVYFYCKLLSFPYFLCCAASYVRIIVAVYCQPHSYLRFAFLYSKADIAPYYIGIAN
jgi:hypothetical protein